VRLKLAGHERRCSLKDGGREKGTSVTPPHRSKQIFGPRERIKGGYRAAEERALVKVGGS
jgi:hypothetical protein